MANHLVMHIVDYCTSCVAINKDKIKTRMERETHRPCSRKVVKNYFRLWYYCGQTKNHRQIGGDFSIVVDPRRIELPNLSDANKPLKLFSSISGYF